MTVPIYKADAFTDTLFEGNPAAVCFLSHWLPEQILQKIAAENNLAETAFLVKSSKGYQLKWFTPVCEIDLCGHATLASAHILYTEIGHRSDKIYFETSKSGVLTVKREEDKYVMDFPSLMPAAVNTPDALVKAMGGKEPSETFRLRDYVLVYKSEDEIRKLDPDFQAITEIDTFGVVVTAPGDRADFVSRFFAPGAGIPEDPVTGSAHCNLIPLWAKKFGKSKLYAEQISARKGKLWCEQTGDRVSMAGNVVTYLKGEISI